MLSNAELTDMRDTIQDYLLPDTCNILSIARSSDGSGGFTEAWGTATAGRGLADWTHKTGSTWILMVLLGHIKLVFSLTV